MTLLETVAGGLGIVILNLLDECIFSVSVVFFVADNIYRRSILFDNKPRRLSERRAEPQDRESEWQGK